jgi:hypothetical protein
MSTNNKKEEMNNDKNSTCRRSKAITTPTTGGCSNSRRNSRKLDREYGPERQVGEGDGGYILILESANKIYIDIDEVVPEFTDVIKVEGAEDYNSTVILRNNDF